MRTLLRTFSRVCKKLLSSIMMGNYFTNITNQNVKKILNPSHAPFIMINLEHMINMI